MISEDKPLLLRNEQEWKNFIKKMDDEEYITHLPLPPTSYPCFVHYYTDHSEWNGYYHQLYCGYFYVEDARELYMTKFLENL